MFRTLIERLARNRVIRRRLPNGRRIYVSPDAQLKYLKRRFDQDLVDLANRHIGPDDVVWDIGANCGVFALSCHKAKQVIAVEPDPFLASLIHRSSSGTNVTALPAAVSNAVEIADLAIGCRGRAGNHLAAVRGTSQAQSARSILSVPTVTLDGLMGHFGPPTFIKIDVESAETQVLEGASRVLAHRPKLYIEIANESRKQCGDMLGQYYPDLPPITSRNTLVAA